MHCSKPGNGMDPSPRNSTDNVVIGSVMSSKPSSFESAASAQRISPRPRKNALRVVQGYDGESVDRPDVVGLPEDRRVGIHRLSDYGEPNALTISLQGSLGKAPLRIPTAPGHYTCLRFLVTSSGGAALLPVGLHYADGTISTERIFAPDWFHDIDRRDSVLRNWNTNAVRNGMDRIYGGRFQSVKDPALFEVIIPTAPEKTLTAIVLDPRDADFGRRQSTRFHLFAITGVRRTTE